ncbi:MAG: hypothetical protein KAS36_11165 [Anaerolineales bacterium]|nr:hypothetical protein [Anaerolineales bacterium]
MKDSQISGEHCSEPETYEIRIQGHLQDRWSDWFERMTITRESDGTTTLSGSLPDQTALHSILLKIRDMNLKLISVKEIQRSPEDKN